ncbi:MAG: polysaccharide biosynthesis/export family protein [Ginsengibacter sp.]
MVLSQKINSLTFIALFSLLLTFLGTSCTTVKKTTYFQDLPNDTTLTDLVTKNFETKIQRGDLLSIAVASLSPENTQIYNAPQSSIGDKPGFLVDEAGNIPFVKLGNIQVAGMTKTELKARLEKDLVNYVGQNVVSIAILNRHITLMGAISPQVLPLTSENMTILDALASSGDIGFNGKVDNVLVIREKENGKEFKRLNLTDKSIFYSPYFYMQPNDIVYVEPVKEKVSTTPQIISWITTGITFTIFIIDRISRTR